MELARVLDEIGDEQSVLSHSRLYMLSDLDRQELELFTERWSTISTPRRRQIVSSLVEIAEADFSVDFNSIFHFALRDEDAEVRAHAIDGLWEDETPALAGVLLEMLSSDPSIRVRSAAATGLGRFVLMAELEELDEDLGHRIVEALLRMTEDPEEALEPQRRAVEAISYSGEDGVRDLIGDAYSHPSERMQISAIFSMGRSADPAWESIVVKELRSSNPEMRFEAARACGELELSEAVPALIRLIADVDREVQQAAIFALGKIGGQEARRALRICCESEDEVIAAAGDEALAELELTAGLFDTFLDLDEH